MTPNVMYGAPFFREDTHGSGTHGSSIWDDELCGMGVGLLEDFIKWEMRGNEKRKLKLKSEEKRRTHLSALFTVSSWSRQRLNIEEKGEIQLLE